MQKLFAMDLLENITTISALPTLDPIIAAEWEHWVKFAFLAVALPNKWYTASVYNVDILEAVGVESGAWEFLILVLILI